MPIVNDYNGIDILKMSLESKGVFQANFSREESPIINFFEYLYAYPQQLTLKWDMLNISGSSEFEQEFNTKDDTKSTNYSLTEETQFNKNLLSNYTNGFLNKVNSSKFYKTETKKIQTSLSTIPIFVVLNCDGELVLTKPTNYKKADNFSTYLTEVLYKYSGAFNLNTELRPKIGFFFTNRLDAENYLQNIAKSDIDGTKTVGLSIHCVGLDTAYKITREPHNDIDFRFVPNLTPSDSLQKSKPFNIGIPIYIVENNVRKAIFLSEDRALNFYKQDSRANNGGQTKYLSDSLENFLEMWEENLANDNKKEIYFFSSLENEENILTAPSQDKGKIVLQSFKQKTRILKKFLGIFFSMT